MEIPTIKNSREAVPMITGLALEGQILAILSRPTFLLLPFHGAVFSPQHTSKLVCVRLTENVRFLSKRK